MPAAPRGLPAIRIKDIQTILTAPNRIRLVVVKVVTDQPGLYGWGCATFTQRALVVQTAIDQYLKPFLIGRRVDEIEDIWQSSYVSSYWRNGGVLFNAMSGVDIALWDILGKRAGLPLYQLLGGKVRHGADCYYHASGRDFQEVEDNARKGMAAGFRHVRVQGGVPGLATYGAGGGQARRTPRLRRRPSRSGRRRRARSGSRPATCGCCRSCSSTCARQLGDEVQLLHDVHERVQLNEGINLCKALEPYNLFFLEDPFPPEDNAWFRQLRQQTSVPIAMGELFNTVQEYLPLDLRAADRLHPHPHLADRRPERRRARWRRSASSSASAPAGTARATPRRSRTRRSSRWSSSTYNFGIHEGGAFPPETREVFRGAPEQKNGYMVANDAPGHGVDVDEKLAAKFPFPPGPPNFDYSWGTTRRRDGTVIRP